MSASSTPEGGKRRRSRKRKDGTELGGTGAQSGEVPVLPAEGGSEEARIVGPERHADAGAEQLPHGMTPAPRKSARRAVRRRADVQGDAPPREKTDQSGILDRPDAVRDADRPKVRQRRGNRVRTTPLAGVNEGREAQPPHAPIDAREVPRGDRQLVPAEPESHDAGPRITLVEVEDPVSGVGTPVPHGVQEHGDPPAVAFVLGEDALQRGSDARPVEADALHDRGRNVDLGVADSLAPEPPHEVAGDERVVRGRAQQPAHVAIEEEKSGGVVDLAPPAQDGRTVGESFAPVTKGELDERSGADGALEVEVKLRFDERAEPAKELGEARAGVRHGPASYARPAGVLPRERLWMRLAATGIDLLVLAGAPLLATTVLVFLVLLATPEPPAVLSSAFRIAQGLFVALFLSRDAQGFSPGKTLFGLKAVRRDGRRLSLLDSIARNLPLAIPVWNVVELVAVLKQKDGRRTGDRAAGTLVVEV